MAQGLGRLQEEEKLMVMVMLLLCFFKDFIGLNWYLFGSSITWAPCAVLNGWAVVHFILTF